MRRTQPCTKKGQNFFNNPCPIATMVHGKQQHDAVTTRDVAQCTSNRNRNRNVLLIILHQLLTFKEIKISSWRNLQRKWLPAIQRFPPWETSSRPYNEVLKKKLEQIRRQKLREYENCKQQKKERKRETNKGRLRKKAKEDEREYCKCVCVRDREFETVKCKRDTDMNAEKA